MTLYLTDDTPPEEIARAKLSGRVHGVKLYPAGATTQFDAGVTRLSRCFHALEKMEELGLPLLVHGEVTDPAIDVFDREQVFIEEVLGPPLERFPRLKVVLEHITTREAAQFVEVTGPNVAATITAHHLLLNRNALFLGGIRPHHYCLPVLKRETHREALVEAATSGNPKFFLGTDSAPHARDTKEAACGCAGIYTAHAAIELYAEAFEEAGALDKLEGFASLRRRILRPAAQRRQRSRWCARNGACPSACASATTSWCRCAPARRSPGSWPSASRSSTRCGRGSRGRALAGGLNALSEEARSQDRKRQAGALRAAGREGRVLRSQRVRDRPGRDPAGQPARSLQRARLARLSAHQGAHQRDARRGDPARGRPARPAARPADDLRRGRRHRAVRRPRAPFAAAGDAAGRSCSGRSATGCARRCASSSSATRCWSRRWSRWPGITCKVIVAVRRGISMPQAATGSAAAPGASPRDLAPLPVFGYPGWVAQDARFYDDTRYFRPAR